MRSVFLKWVICSLLLVAVGATSFAQTRKKQTNTKKSAYGNNTQTPPPAAKKTAYGNQQDTTVKNQNSAYGPGGAAQNGIDTTLPIEVITTNSGGLLDSAMVSLRNDAGVEQNLIKDKVPLPYEPIREDDAVFRVKVWREIDTREKLNQPFMYAADDDNGSQRFISVLLRAIKSGDVTAFSGSDDRFTTPITGDDAINAFGNGRDTVKKYDLDGNVIGYQVRPRAIDPAEIHTFRLKEEWIFDKESSRLFVRLLGIAPVIPIKLSNCQILPNSEHPVFWVYYPDIRPVFAKTEVYNPKNSGARMSWDDLFESRMFSSYVIKSSLDNPGDLDLSGVYPNSTLFRLLEGDRIKEKIFNYEQSLWQY